MKLGRDQLSISFRLNREAKFSNGDPVLAKDVVFSYETLISGDGVNPFFKNYWADIKGVSIVSDREVKFTFRKKIGNYILLLLQCQYFLTNGVRIEKISRYCYRLSNC